MPQGSDDTQTHIRRNEEKYTQEKNVTYTGKVSKSHVYHKINLSKKKKNLRCVFLIYWKVLLRDAIKQPCCMIIQVVRLSQ